MILNSNDGERGITRRSSADVMKAAAAAGPGGMQLQKETETKHCSGYILATVLGTVVVVAAFLLGWCSRVISFPFGPILIKKKRDIEILMTDHINRGIILKILFDVKHLSKIPTKLGPIRPKNLSSLR